MAYKAVIFDLDGTLLDTLAEIGDAMNTALKNRGLPTHPIERYRHFIGEGPRVLVERALPENRRSEPLMTDCLNDYIEIYSRNFGKSTRVYEGIPELLDALTRHRLMLAVLSNKRHTLTIRSVDRFLSDWHFHMVLGLRDSVARKPDPAGALEIAGALGVPSERIAYLGDSGTDIQTARAAGMFPVGVLWGTRSQEELETAGAGAVIDKPKKALDILLPKGV
ncbi:MAG: HAD family hydrolase [Desulfobacterales bacterium]